MIHPNPVIGQVCEVCGHALCCYPNKCDWQSSSAACVHGGWLAQSGVGPRPVQPRSTFGASPISVALAQARARQMAWLAARGMTSRTMHPQTAQAMVVQASLNPCAYRDYERAQRQQRIANARANPGKTRTFVRTAYGRRVNPEACCDACAQADGDPDHSCPCEAKANPCCTPPPLPLRPPVPALGYYR